MVVVVMMLMRVVVVRMMVVVMDNGDGMPDPSVRSCIRPLHRSHTAPDDCHVDIESLKMNVPPGKSTHQAQEHRGLHQPASINSYKEVKY